MSGPNERDEIAAVLDPHWRTDCSDAVGDTYVRWVRCRCGWESERSGSRINAPDMHRVWNEHLADLLAERDRRTAATALASVRALVEPGTPRSATAGSPYSTGRWDAFAEVRAALDGETEDGVFSDPDIHARLTRAALADRIERGE